ncbi:MAG: rhomboid family intramembrane serine protease [Actinobacteria bacterium]|nr:rhomboid family intramembrane serine protease [Actinomycetota bacterium]
MASTEQTQAMTCYRHPGTETAVSCSNCGRPICTDCMVFASVGIKCPECSGQPMGAKKVTRRARRVAGDATGGLATKALIALNLGVFLLQISQGDLRGIDSTVFEKGALRGLEVAEGEWWRLVTAGFLHIGPIHILFNLLMLYWFGTPLETLLGRGRFLAVYGIAILAGSTGALLLTGAFDVTVGASAGVFGILGAGLVLERRGINVFGGAALAVVVFNIALSFLLNNISIGGHVGGLVGGALAITALSQFGRAHAAYARITAVSIASLVAIAVATVVIAYARVRGYA